MVYTKNRKSVKCELTEKTCISWGYEIGQETGDNETINSSLLQLIFKTTFLLIHLILIFKINLKSRLKGKATRRILRQASELDAYFPVYANSFSRLDFRKS